MTLSTSISSGIFQILLGITTDALSICLDRNENLTITVLFQWKVGLKWFFRRESHEEGGITVERSFWNRSVYFMNTLTSVANSGLFSFETAIIICIVTII